MAVAVYVHPENLTAAQYDAVHAKLEALGANAPEGRLHHSCFGEPGGLMIYDVWESQAAFEAWAQVLGPILGEVGVVGGAPHITPIHDLA